MNLTFREHFDLIFSLFRVDIDEPYFRGAARSLHEARADVQGRQFGEAYLND